MSGVARLGSPRWAALALVVLVAPGCTLFGPSSVTRRVHGRTIEGPFVSPEAYAAFVRGSVHEAHGELTAAKSAYEMAAREAPDLAEPLARLGAVRCRAGDDPSEAFRRAGELDPELATVFIERARCDLLRGHAREAIAPAQTAMRLAPSDPTTSLLLIDVLRGANDVAGAVRVESGLRARFPDDPRIVALSARSSAVRASAEPRGLEALGPVDDAVRRGDEPAAERLASTARISLATVALRAAALGRAAHAARLAALVFEADPTSSDARIALLVANDLLRDDDGFRRALAPLLDKEPDVPPSPLGAALLVDVVRRRTRVSLPLPPLPPDAADEPLLRAVRARQDRAPASVAGAR